MHRHVFATTLIVLTIAACGGRSPATSNAEPIQADPAPLAVEVVKVARGALITSVEATGAVQGVAEAFVVSETQGIVKSVQFELGDRVEVNQILATVDDTVARLAMEEAAQQAETTRLELESTQKLAGQGNASRASLTRAEAAANGSRARYEVAVKAYRDTSVRAPISGAVASIRMVLRSTILGNLLTPGTPVARIVDLSTIRIEVSVGETEVGLMEPGLEAQLQVPAACGSVTYSGVVRAVAAGSDPRTGSYTVVISASNPCPVKIRSGMTAFVSILTNRQYQALLMPIAALVKGSAGDSVYTVTDGQIRQVPVRLGRILGDVAEILEGPEEGTLLAVSGLPALRQGMRVQPTTIEAAGISP